MPAVGKEWLVIVDILPSQSVLSRQRAGPPGRTDLEWPSSTQQLPTSGLPLAFCLDILKRQDSDRRSRAEYGNYAQNLDSKTTVGCSFFFEKRFIFS
jgi:hypothetical protein